MSEARALYLAPSLRVGASPQMPLYMQVARALIEEVRRGRLPPGSPVPSSREFARTLQVNRKTVVVAYEELIAQGWLVSMGTRGTIVSTRLPEQPFEQCDDPAVIGADESAAYAFELPPDEPLSVPTGDWIKLDEGTPDGRLFPVESLSRAFRQAVHDSWRHNRLQYRDPRGSVTLRRSIANMLRAQRGLVVTEDHICITRGSQMGIFLAARILVRPGDAVLMEELTYAPAIAAFRGCGARIVPVGLEPDGLSVEDVERACRAHRVRAIFLTPHHQFPTTVSLSPEKRLRLLDLARQFGFAVIEDDYDHEFHFGGQPLLPMASYAPSHVIYAGSLSKLLLPALRVGYVVAPPEVIGAMAHQVSVVDGMGNAITEEAAARLHDSGEMRRHARKATRIYAARRDSFDSALQEILGDLVDYTVPLGGLAYWLRFKTPADLDRLEANAVDAGLRFASSRSFVIGANAERGLRIGFASLTEAEARRALKLVRRASGH